jgi:hypothetical protein
MIKRIPRAALAGVLALSLACGGDSNADAPPAEASEEAEASSSPAPAEAAPSNPGAAPLTVADIDAWQKGMAAELQAVRDAAAKMKSARTGDDSLAALMGVQETSTEKRGAEAAGMELERYKVVRSELSSAVSYLTPHLGGIDTTMLSPEQRTELRQSNEEQLKQMADRVPAQVVEALRPRAEELRKQNLELVGARLKGAGM